MIRIDQDDFVTELDSKLEAILVLKVDLFFFRVLTAGRQLAKSLELQSLNDLGFSKRYVRCLQVHVNLC